MLPTAHTPAVRGALVVLAASLVFSVLAPTMVAAADPEEIGIIPLENLLRGADPNGFLEPGGGYHVEYDVQNSSISADLTYQLPALATTAEQGPTVVFWEYSLIASDTEFGDSSSQMVTPPDAEVVQLSCTKSGTCALHLRVVGPAAPALEAADLDWVRRVWVSLLATVAQTYDDGARVQLFSPGYVDQTAGTLAGPRSVDGPLLSTGLIDIATTNVVDVPGTDFWVGGPPYDWAAALEDEVGQPAPSASSGPETSQSPAPQPPSNSGIPAAAYAVVVVVVMGIIAIAFLIGRRRGGE